MSVLLDAVYVNLLIICSPWLAYRAWRQGKYRRGWGAKLLGRAPHRSEGQPRIWFHAVSVGEVLALRPVVEALRRQRPEVDLVLSTTTATGFDLARRTFPELPVFFAPLDLSWAVRHAVARIRPTVLALVELELWPNLIAEVRRRGGRVALINARLSLRSHRGYRALRGPLGPTFRGLDRVAAQSSDDAERFADLGIADDRLIVTGSVKYDGLESDRDNASTTRLRRLFALDPTSLVFVAGSTMAGEEEAAWRAYERARALPEGKRLRLIIVPRHPERFDAVASSLERWGARPWRRSKAGSGTDPSGEGGSDPDSVILVDSVGELGAVWGLADLAFVGGSLFPGRGGQNMMEPAAYGASVLFGPHTSNFRSAVDLLLAGGAAQRVVDPNDLIAAVVEAVRDPQGNRERGHRARRLVLQQRGATRKTLNVLDSLVG